jgi:hypothetical protein
MALYASTADLEAYVADNPDAVLSGDPEAQERLLARAERTVDLALGPWPFLESGRKLDPETLDEVQRAALSRATCAAAEHELIIGLSVLAGDADYAPSEVQIALPTLITSPRMLRELAGHNLVRRSGCVTTPPDPTTGSPGWPEVP